MKYSNWTAFKAYHSWAEALEKFFKRALVVYVLLVLVQMVFTWFQLIPLKQQFAAGEKKATCIDLPVTSEGIVPLDCGGYYEPIVEARNKLVGRNGCIMFGYWQVMDGGEVQDFGLWLSGPLCIKPFPFGSLFTLEPGSVFSDQ